MCKLLKCLMLTGILSVTTCGSALAGQGIGESNIFSIDNRFQYSGEELPEESQLGAVIMLSGFSDDPVNMATGNFYYDYSDLTIATRSMPFEFKRHYNSKDATFNPLGIGWTHSYNISLTSGLGAGGDKVAVRWGDGRTDYWISDGAGGYSPDIPGLYDKLETDGSLWTVTRKNLDRYIFNSSGKLQSILDKNDNTFTLGYNVTGLMETVTDPAGRSVTLEYYPEGTLREMRDPAGRTFTYEYADGRLNRMVDPLGNMTSYEYDESGYLAVITNALGVRTVSNTYDGEGRVTQQTDGNGNVTTFAYGAEAEFKKTTITNPDTTQIDHLHSQNNLLLMIRYPIGSISYAYDDNNNRTAIVDRNGNVANFVYDIRSNVIETIDPNDPADPYDNGITTVEYNDARFPDLPTKKIDAMGNATTWEYDAKGNCTTETDNLGNTTRWTYNSFGKKLTEVDKNGNTTMFVYDGDGKLSEAVDPLGNTTSFEYDELWRPVQVTNALGHRTQTTYDELGRIVQINGPLTTMQYEYDPVGNKIREINPNGNSTQYSYDSNNNLVSVTNALGNTVSYTYDGLDRRITQTDANGNVTQYAYDELGWLIAQTDPLGNISSFTYDHHGNVLSTTDGAGVTTRFEYDTLNRKVHQYDQLNRHLYFEYDKIGNLTKQMDVPHANNSHNNDSNLLAYWNFEESNGATVYDKSKNNNSLTVNGPTFELGILDKALRFDGIDDYAEIADSSALHSDRAITISGWFFVDSFDKTWQTVFWKGNSPDCTDGCDNREYCLWLNQNGYLLFTSASVGTDQIYCETSPGTIKTNHWYHFAAVINSDDDFMKIYVNGDEKASGVYSNTGIINSSGPLRLGNNPTWDSHFNGSIDDISIYSQALNDNEISSLYSNRTQYQYDPLNRLISVTDAMDGVTAYQYDAVGNLTEMKDAGGKIITRKVYDMLGRLIQQTDGNGNASQYTYDALGNLISATDANGDIKQFEYDSENRLLKKRYADATQVVYTYDLNGNLTSMTDPTGTTNYSYDALDRLISSNDSFGKTVEYGYDANNNRTSLVYPNDSTNPTRTVSYSYDSANRLDNITDWDDRTWDYTVDEAGRITELVYPNGTIKTMIYDEAARLANLHYVKSDATPVLSFSYTRDAQGNPTKIDETGTLAPDVSALTGKTGYTYDDDNRLVSTTIPSTYGYDGNGNVTSRIAGGVTTSFAYNFDNRLTSYSRPGLTVQHTYNGHGNRIARSDNGTETQYILDHSRSMSHILCETDGSGEITAYYIHGPEIVGRIGTDGTLRYYHTDAIGSVIALTDEAESVTDKYTYTPFGTLAGKTGTTANPFTYVGGLGVMADADNLYFMRARFYEPETGRFFGKDPVDGALIEPTSLHRYSYASNNPFLYIDPEGLIVRETIQLTGSVADLALTFTEIFDRYDTGKEVNWAEYGVLLGAEVAQIATDATEIVIGHGNPLVGLAKEGYLFVKGVSDGYYGSYDRSASGGYNIGVVVGAWSEYGFDNAVSAGEKLYDTTTDGGGALYDATTAAGSWWYDTTTSAGGWLYDTFRNNVPAFNDPKLNVYYINGKVKRIN